MSNPEEQNKREHEYRQVLKQLEKPDISPIRRQYLIGEKVKYIEHVLDELKGKTSFDKVRLAADRLGYSEPNARQALDARKSFKKYEDFIQNQRAFVKKERENPINNGNFPSREAVLKSEAVGFSGITTSKELTANTGVLAVHINSDASLHLERSADFKTILEASTAGITSALMDKLTPNMVRAILNYDNSNGKLFRIALDIKSKANGKEVRKVISANDHHKNKNAKNVDDMYKPIQDTFRHKLEAFKVLAKKYNDTELMNSFSGLINSMVGKATTGTAIWQDSELEFIDDDEVEISVSLLAKVGDVTDGFGNWQSFNEFLENDIRKYIKELNNDDNLCLLYTIMYTVLKNAPELLYLIDYTPQVISKSEKKNMYLDKENKPTQLLVKLTDDLIKCAELTVVSGEPLNVDTVEKLEKFFKRNFPIITYRQGQRCCELIYLQHNFEVYLPIFFNGKDHYEPLKNCKEATYRHLLAHCDSQFCLICNKAKCNAMRNRGPHVQISIHPSIKRCNSCLKTDCKTIEPGFVPTDDGSSRIICENCLLYFSDRSCYNNHPCNPDGLEENLCHNCGLSKFNDGGNQTGFQKVPHKCYHGKCKFCKEVHHLSFNGSDSCCRLTDKKPENPKMKSYIFFDFETSQKTKEHVVIYAHAARCLANGNGQRQLDKRVSFMYKYPNFGTASTHNDIGRLSKKIENRIYGSESKYRVIDEFCFWLFSDPINNESTAIAHYGKGFDFHFIVDFVKRYPDLFNLHQIRNGAKLMSMSVSTKRVIPVRTRNFGSIVTINFIDSKNHINNKLADFTKIFGLDPTKQVKGHFPHTFDGIDNWDYDGPLPDALHFSVLDAKSNEEKKALIKWHMTESELMKREGRTWNYFKEMEKYCKADVDLLMDGCLAYLELTREIMNRIAPDTNFTALDYSTLAATAMAFFRTACLNMDAPAEKSIYADDHGFQAYMKWVFNCSKYFVKLQQLRPAVSGINSYEYIADEKPINNVGLDLQAPLPSPGQLIEHFVDEDGMPKAVHHFLLSCHFHGCPDCAPVEAKRQASIFTGKSIQKSFEHAMKAMQPFHNGGVQIKFIYECKASEFLDEPDDFGSVTIHRQNGEVFTVPVNSLHRHITRNELLTGGRTAPTQLFYEGKYDRDPVTGKIIGLQKIDVVSLYPTIMKYSRYPIGRPLYFTSKNIDEAPLLNPIARWTPEMLTRELTDPVCGADYAHFMAFVAEGGNPMMFDASRDKYKFDDMKALLNGPECKAFLEKKKTSDNHLMSFREFVGTAVSYEYGYHIKEEWKSDYPVFRDESQGSNEFLYFHYPVGFVFNYLYPAYCNAFYKKYNHYPHIHEVVRHNTVQRVRFDLDFPAGFRADSGSISSSIQEFIWTILQACQKVIDLYYPAFAEHYKLSRFSTVITTSSNEVKQSYHIITGIIGINSVACKTFADLVHTLIKDHPLFAAIDQQVHKKTQSFRMIYSSKASDPLRHKREDDEIMSMVLNRFVADGDYMLDVSLISEIGLYMDSCENTSKSCDSLRDIVIRDSDGMLCLKNGSKRKITTIPIIGNANYQELWSPNFEQYYKRTTLIDKDSGIFGMITDPHTVVTSNPTIRKVESASFNLETVLALLSSSISDFDETWANPKVKGNLISFTRKQSSFCNHCSRQHDNDNTLYAFVGNDGNVCTRCFHDKSKKTIVVGKIVTQTVKEPSKVQKSSKTQDSDDDQEASMQPNSPKKNATIKLLQDSPTVIYNLFDVATGKIYPYDKKKIEFLSMKNPRQFKLINLKLKASEKEYYELFYEGRLSGAWNAKESIISAKVLVDPPNNLFHPILLKKENGKVVADLLPRVGCYTHPELKKAVEYGYVIHAVYDIHYHRHSTDTMFAKYINTFYKIKMMAEKDSVRFDKSGKPDEEAIDGFLETLDKHIGANPFGDGSRFITKQEYIANGGKGNPGLRAVAKLFLNSLWGKFGENLDRVHHSLITTRAELDAILDDPKIDHERTNFFHQVGADYLEASFTRRFEELNDRNYTNMYIASYTTANARMVLWEGLNYLGERVVYYDTDSIIYRGIAEKGERNMPIGSLIGEWSCELGNSESWTEIDKNGNEVVCTYETHNPANSITQWLAAGPKSYAYKVNNHEKMLLKNMGALGDIVAFKSTNASQCEEIIVIYKTEAGPKKYAFKTTEEAERFIDSRVESYSVDGTKATIKFRDNPPKEIDFSKTIHGSPNEFISTAITKSNLSQRFKAFLGKSPCFIRDFIPEVSIYKDICSSFIHGDYYMKHKGITLNVKNSTELNFELFKGIIFDQIQSALTENPKLFSFRTPKSVRFVIKRSKIICQEQDKMFKLTHDKSLILVYGNRTDGNQFEITGIKTAPFGYDLSLLKSPPDFIINPIDLYKNLQ